MKSGNQRYLCSALAAVRLIHAFPSATVIAGSGLLMLVAHQGVPPLGVLLRGVAVVAGSQVAVGALNDYLDRHDDARTQPEKPLPSGAIGVPVAVALVVIGIVVCVAIASSFGPVSLGIASLGLASGLVYDLGLKRTPFSPASYLVSFLSLLTWIWFIAGTLRWTFALLYPFGACLLLAAHVANALPDAETDAVLGHRGLAVVLGPRHSLQLVLSVTASAAVFTIILCGAKHVIPGLGLALLAAVLIGAAVRLGRNSDLGRQSLLLIFRCVAPAIALIAAACLLAFGAAP